MEHPVNLQMAFIETFLEAVHVAELFLMSMKQNV